MLVDWSSVGTWFGTCSAPSTTMRACSLVYPLFVAQTTWFGTSDFCSAKGEWVEYSIEGHEIRDGNNVWGFRLGEAPIRHMKLLLAKGASLLLRGEVGWFRAELGGVSRLEVLEKSLDLRQVLQLGWVIVGGKSDVFIFVYL